MNLRTLTVTEKALEPEIRFGSEAECTNELKPASGDFIVYFRNGTAEPIFRRWQIAPDGSILLQSLNRECSSYTCAEADLLANGTVFVILSVKRYFRPVSTPSAEQPDTEYLTFTEAMALLKVHRTRMYELLQSGRLPATKLGRLWRIPKSALRTFLSENQK